VKLAAVLLASLVAAPALAGEPAPKGLDQEVDIEERLGEQLPMDVPLTTSEGDTVRLRDLVKDRPVILNLVYYRCPVLCGLLTAGMIKAFRQMDWQVGREFDIVTVSLDPNEPIALAAEKKRGFLQALDEQANPTARKGWHFTVATEQVVRMIAGAVGFKFKYVERERQFAHVAALFVLTPKGAVSRYFYGVEFEPRQLKLGLFEAADGRVGTTFERVLMRCYRYDPASRRYELFVKSYFRIVGLLLLLAVGGMLVYLWRRDLQGRARVQS
jgi:protein SCO1/2